MDDNYCVLNSILAILIVHLVNLVKLMSFMIIHIVQYFNSILLHMFSLCLIHC